MVIRFAKQMLSWLPSQKQLTPRVSTTRKKQDERLKGKVSTSPAFKRQYVPQPMREALVAEITKRFNAEGARFFSALPQINPDSIYVKRFLFKGHPAVIKDTYGDVNHGQYPTELRHMLAIHQIEAKNERINTRSYLLRTPKVYGQVGNYIIMEEIQDYKKSPHCSASEKDLIADAQYDFDKNMRFLSEQLKFDRTLPEKYQQGRHAITAGIVNGRVILYAPYDLA
ncbi:MAG: hypothetical protein WCW13_04385 [archaeon]|jgi:hypothetical protein